MQIPAGESRQGSAEKMTDGERYTRWPVMDLPHNRNPLRKSMQVHFVGSGLSPRQAITARRIRIYLSSPPSQQT